MVFIVAIGETCNLSLWITSHQQKANENGQWKRTVDLMVNE
jgi:hypothetical protein